MNGLRLGTYATMQSWEWVNNKQGDVSLIRTLACSSVSGVIGGFVGSPIFLVKTHLQTSSSSGISVGYQHNHGNMTTAFKKLFKDGGIVGLWQGATASIPRISR